MSVTAFAIVPVPLLSTQGLTPLDHSVYSALASHARPGKPLVWPSRQRIANLVDASIWSVSRSLKRLAEAGWIAVRRTGRANRITVFDAPNAHQMCAEAHIASLYEETIEDSPLPPVGGESGEVVPQDEQADAVERQPDSQQEREQAKTAERQQERDDTEQPQAAQHAPTDRETARRLERVSAAQKVIARLNTVTGSQLPTDAESATVSRVSSVLTHYPESDLIAVIEAKGGEFRHPAALLNPRVVEMVLGEIRAREAATERQREREREMLRRASLPAVNPERAQSAIGAMKRALGRFVG